MGRWGEVLVNAVQGRSTRVRFVAGTSRRLDRASAFAARQGIELLPDLDAILARPDVDGVVLATPHSEHVPQIIASVRAGKPAFCEKPLALTLADATSAYDAASDAGRALCVGFNRRFLPSYKALVARLPEIGDRIQMIGNFSWAAPSYPPGGWRNDPAESPAGGMTGLGIHVVDAMIGLGLSPVSVSLATRPVGVDASQHVVTALIEAGPAVGVLTTMLGPGRSWRLDAFGTKGRMAMDGEERLVVQRAGEAEEVTIFDHLDIERAELEHFAAVVAEGGAWPIPRSEALRGAALFEAICDAATGQRQMATLAHVPP